MIRRLTKHLVTTAALLGLAFAASSANAQACGAADELETFECIPKVARLNYGNVLLGSGRIDYMLPTSARPAKGWPVVVLYHGGSGNASGALYRANGCENPDECTCEDPDNHDTCELLDNGSALKNRRGHAARTMKSLLAAGYAVLLPYATAINWQSDWPDVISGLTPYTSTSDYKFLNKLFGLVGVAGQTGELAFLGTLDKRNMFATGISDGGGQASRTARQWTTMFRAVAINDGYWSTCTAFGSPCNPTVSFAHPPTLLTHAEGDPTVPLKSAKIYAKWLKDHNIRWRAVIAPQSFDTDTVSLDVGIECGRAGADPFFCIESNETAVVAGYAHDWLYETPKEHVRFFNRFRIP